MSVMITYKHTGDLSETREGRRYADDFYDLLKEDDLVILEYLENATSSQLRDLCQILNVSLCDFSTHNIDIDKIDVPKLKSWVESSNLSNNELSEFLFICHKRRDRIVTIMLQPYF